MKEKKENAEDVNIPYVSVLTDFGFKRCFCDPVTMRSFLNAMLGDDYGQIEQVVFENVEMPADIKEGRGVNFDLRCTTDDGTEVLIEMQNYPQKLFKTRANYYLCRLMDKHIGLGYDWSVGPEIPKMIGIFILGKPMAGIDKLITRTAECDLDTHKEFWDRMRKYFILLSEFDDQSCQTWTMKEAWLETIKNIGMTNKIDPRVYELADEGLLALIEKAKVSALSPEEYALYLAEMKAIGDINAPEMYGYHRGIEEGIEKGIQQGMLQGAASESRRIAKEMKENGISIDVIIKISQLSREEIEQL